MIKEEIAGEVEEIKMKRRKDIMWMKMKTGHEMIIIGGVCSESERQEI